MNTMIFTMKHLLICVLLFTSACLASNENEVPSKITVKENFNNPAIVNPVSPYGPPPIVSNFVHQGTNFFFNPQFLLGTNIAPPLGAVVAAIPNVEVNINESIMPTEVIAPVEVIVEEPFEIIAPPPPPPAIEIISEVTEVPVLIRDIPPAPVLPPLVLPEIPVWVEESVEIVPDCKEKEIVITEVNLPPVVIPQPPSLPPLVLPPKITVSEIEVKTPVEPSVVDMAVIVEKDVNSGFSKVKWTNEESLQVVPLKAPVAEIDFKMNEISNTNDLSEVEKMFSINEDKTVIMVPPSLELPVIEFPKPISDVLLIEKDKKVGLTTDCARNIVLERVLPNMISKKTVTKSLEIISFPAVPYSVIPQI